jgi:hypothetical protein
LETLLVEETFLDDNFLRQLMSVGEVDLLVGIPSHNNAKSISQTVTTIEDCFQQNFVRDRVVIVNVDGGSRDGTSEAVLNPICQESKFARLELSSYLAPNHDALRQSAFARRGTPGNSCRRGFVASKGLRNHLAGNLQLHSRVGQELAPACLSGELRFCSAALQPP